LRSALKRLRPVGKLPETGAALDARQYAEIERDWFAQWARERPETASGFELAKLADPRRAGGR
jgi:hypothetical protein